MLDDHPRLLPESHLFTVRVWAERVDAERTEWRGQICNVGTGETRYFRKWSALVRVLLEWLSECKRKDA
jgi:hypothetical protein